MAGGGGAWKVAYADFVTAMMAFFMVMWLTSQKPDVKEAIAEYFNNPTGRQISGSPNKSLLPNRDAAGGRKGRTKGKESAKDQTKMTDEGARTNVGTVVSFNANSVALSDESKKKIDDMLPELQGKPHRIEVRGHALSDSQQSGDVSLDALNISFQRSLATMQYLVTAGIEPNRIRLSQSGASEPLLSNNEVDTAANARVEIYLLGETYEAPSETIRRLVSTKAAIAAADAAPEEAPSSEDSHGKAAKPKSGGVH